MICYNKYKNKICFMQRRDFEITDNTDSFLYLIGIIKSQLSN